MNTEYFWVLGRKRDLSFAIVECNCTSLSVTHMCTAGDPTTASRFDSKEAAEQEKRAIGLGYLPVQYKLTIEEVIEQDDEADSDSCDFATAIRVVREQMPAPAALIDRYVDYLKSLVKFDRSKLRNQEETHEDIQKVLLSAKVNLHTRQIGTLKEDIKVIKEDLVLIEEGAGKEIDEVKAQQKKLQEEVNELRNIIQPKKEEESAEEDEYQLFNKDWVEYVISNYYTVHCAYRDYSRQERHIRYMEQRGWKCVMNSYTNGVARFRKDLQKMKGDE